ncbi:MAG: PRD domain-containing protein [Longibaculum sp.]
MIFPLAIHLKMMNERQVHQKARFVREINKIKQNNPKEYLIAKNMIQNIQKKILVQHPEEETCFLAIYFQKFQSRYYDNQKKIAVLVVSHGHVASAMAQTANMIMGEYHAVGLDLEFSDSPKIMADKVIAKVHEIDQGKGCIILADMGSLLQVGERVEKEIGVAVGVLGRCDTLMVIECLRKTLWTNETIDEIVESLDIKETRHIYQNQNRIHERAKVLIVV